MTSPYPLMLSPINIGKLRLPNRVVMGSLHTRLENEPDAPRLLAAFYAARARGGAGLIITGGVSPNFEGRVEEGGQVLDGPEHLAGHQAVTAAVHAAGGLIAMQVLHTGIYGKHDQLVGPMAAPSPINRRVPRMLTDAEIERTVDDFARCAVLARQAGYDAIELMGSEGYLLTQFTAARTNQRTDRWGGTFGNRLRFPLEVVRRTRALVGPDFPVIYRISAIDLVEGGLTAAEVDQLALGLQAAGVDALNTGIGWHEAVVPTIATSVPRAAFAFAAARLKRVVSIPVIASNRINMPDVAEALLARGDCDLVSMARPFLADADFVRKAGQGRSDEINTCIGCNQACLDRIFEEKRATCLVNPQACHETEFSDTPPAIRKRVAVIGAGPAGMACAATAAERGHDVVLIDAAAAPGGQIDLARRIPGKEQEFGELMRYFARRLETSGVRLRMGQPADAAALAAEGFDHVVVATGIRPRAADFPGAAHAKVVGYVDVILGRVKVGGRVAVIGTGGIGHDVAELLTAPPGTPSVAEFLDEWGVDASFVHAGGLKPPASPTHGTREVTLMQRSHTRPGARLGKSTGWIHRTRLLRRGVQLIGGCRYDGVDDAGLHYSVDGVAQPVMPVDHVVVCAGQEAEQTLAQALAAHGVTAGLIGGARFASELDAMRAIDEGTRLAWSF